ncbi:MAG: hypothetical protein ABJF23_29945 [Bryobacteraceae bacterium]
MIDKLEVRIPSRTQFSSQFSGLYRDISSDEKVNPFKTAQHYIKAGDLRAFGYPAILHIHCTRDKQGNHKLELIDTADLSLSAMGREIERVFDVSCRRLGLMRIDLAADVPSVPISWFASHARVRWKQWTADVGHLEFAQMGRQKIETLYFGKRPNCFRIYDKLAELHHQYAQLLRRASDAAEIPTFVEKFGYPETGFVLTRVERQIGGSRIPAQIEQFDNLRKLAAFNPFENLELSCGGQSLPPSIDDYGLMAYLAGMGARVAVEEMGMHRFRSLLNRHSAGNATRILRKVRDFLPCGAGIDSKKLFMTYQESVSRQLAA